MLVSQLAILGATAGATNSAYAGMQGQQAILALANSSANNYNQASFGNEFLSQKQLNSMRHQEQRLTFGMLNNWLQYKINDTMLPGWKKIQNDNIQRTFSTFA